MVALVNIVHISSKTVFVQFFMGGSIPEAAGVRGDFVCQNDGTVAELTKLQLEVYQDVYKRQLKKIPISDSGMIPMINAV